MKSRHIPGSSALMTAVVGLALATALGCSDAAEHSPLANEEQMDAPGEEQAHEFDHCVHNGEGCPCEGEGTIVGCGVVVEQIGDYKFCSDGFRLCEEGAWSHCATAQQLGLDPNSNAD